ncbi:MAG: DUF1993 domain-containing protein [Phenylobacterium sp.]|uniref:DUF1993 domain-containing protein n=1 Tax=Phenylobacterium sp. TaxID=1871053 RepID=UPI001A50756C|nr:DUF1993 domain-containing protein [Phenylobacterium sp.]MBL8553591.1 DUF1993 domain-containing protein [Phenylobacterium sp.]
MAITLYDASVRTFLQILPAVAGYLEKARAHAVEAGRDPEDLVEARLCDDQWPLRSQVISTVHHARGAIAGVKAGVFRPPNWDAGSDYAGLQKMVADAVAELSALTPNEVNALEDQDLVFELGPRQMPFRGGDFLLSFSLPNFYFHATTGYDVLRARGAPLGKRDFMGVPRVKT